jgi:hypothetical protein
MGRSRRNDELEINFDGLTDSVTNLVGALILLVVLIVGVTKALPTANTPPPPIAPQGWELPAETRTIEELQRKVNLLTAHVARLDQEINQYEQSIVPNLEKQVEELIDDVARRGGQAGGE